MKKILLPLFAFASLSACASLWHREGVGFTGIDGEPRTIQDVPEAADYVARRESVPAELAGVPTVRLQTEGGSIDDLAGIAIANGGRTPLNAIEVGGNDQTLMLSTVEVNGVLFAVLRTQENGNRIPADSAGAFSTSVPRLTGCLVGGRVYQAGSGNKTNGLGVPLDCR